MKPSKKSPNKGVQVAASKLRKPVPKRKAVLTMPITRSVVANDHAARIAKHRDQLDSINDAYRLSTRDVFNEPGSLAEKKRQMRKNMRQLAKALGDWHCTALDLLQEGQQAALMQMLPDFKGERWTN